jgi:hypothetical protein
VFNSCPVHTRWTHEGHTVRCNPLPRVVCASCACQVWTERGRVKTLVPVHIEVNPHLPTSKFVAIVHVGQWVLPWLCVTGVAALLVFGAQKELTVAASRASEAMSTPTGVPGEARTRWVTLTSTDGAGNPIRVTCFAPPTIRAADDEISVPAKDLAEVAASLCPDLRVDL